MIVSVREHLSETDGREINEINLLWAFYEFLELLLHSHDDFKNVSANICNLALGRGRVRA